MEDHIFDPRERRPLPGSLERVRELRRRTLKQMDDEVLDELQLQEFLKQNDEQARRRAECTRWKASTDNSGELPLWVVVAAPILLVVLQIGGLFWFRADLFDDIPLLFPSPFT
eukprot:Sspe_Gene.49721::Locus_27038_Transcript_1_1_Confidence_1.000_Length_621::g.49721::m.49721